MKLKTLEKLKKRIMRLNKVKVIICQKKKHKKNPYWELYLIYPLAFNNSAFKIPPPAAPLIVL